MRLRSRQARVRAARLGRGPRRARGSPRSCRSATGSSAARGRSRRWSTEFMAGSRRHGRRDRPRLRRAGPLPARAAARAPTTRARQVLLDNMPSRSTGRPGYRVLTPLQRADGRGWVLVDRGWVPLGASREDLPDVAVGGGPREVSGMLDVLPVPGLRVGPAAAPGAAGWPRVLLFPTEADVESALGVAVESRIILLDRRRARRLRAQVAARARLRPGAPPGLRDPVVRVRAGDRRAVHRTQPAPRDRGRGSRSVMTTPDPAGRAPRPPPAAGARRAVLRAARAGVLDVLRTHGLATGRRRAARAT